MTTDRPLLGIALMIGFCVMAPLADAFSKLLAPGMGVVQIVALRFAVQAAVLIPLTVATRRAWRLSPPLLGLVALRTLLHIAGIATMVTALIHLPLADAVAIAYVMPFLLLLLCHWLLGEEVGWRRIAACVAGFAGTLMVVQPAFEEVGPPALLPLLVALIFALFMLVTRRIAGATDPVGMQAVSSVMALGVLVPALAFAPAGLGALSWTPPPATGWWLALGMGLTGTLAHLLMTWSLRFAPAATVAPMQYVEIPMATLVGYVVFADLPGPLAGIGIAVTLAAGVFIVLRERAILRSRFPAPGAARKDMPPAG